MGEPRRRALEQVLLHSSRARSYLVATLAVLVAAAAWSLLLPGRGGAVLFQLFVLAGLAASLAGGLGPGVWATALGALFALLSQSPSGTSGSLADRDDLVRLVLYLATALAAVTVGSGLRQSLLREERLVRGSARVAQLLGRAGREPRSDREAPVIVEALTDREVEVLRLVALGLRNGEIARTLVVSENTVKTHLAHAFGKLGVRSRTEAVAIGSSLGLLGAPDPSRDATAEVEPDRVEVSAGQGPVGP